MLSNRKQAGILFSASLREAAMYNSEKFDWARELKENVVEAAAPWKMMSDDELWSLMFAPTLAPRSLMVWSNGYCPATGEPAPMYSWTYDPFNHPWKVKCPESDHWFPTNDFKAFYDSGIDPLTGVYNPSLADRSLLYNTDHPDPNDPKHLFGVDDGTGFEMDGNKWYFVGYYQYHAQWNHHILPGIRRLAAAYMVTEDKEYSRKAAILLDRVADFFPNFDYKKQGLNYEKYQSPGYITYMIDSAYDVLHMVEAYDQIFDGIKDDSDLVKFLSEKAKKYSKGISNPKTSFDFIQDNIEQRIFREALSHPEKIYTNYPGTDITISTIHTVLDWPQSRDEVLQKINSIVLKSTTYDGLTGERGLPNYSAYPIQRLSVFLGKYARIDSEFMKSILDSYPALHDSYRFFADLWAYNRYYPHSGDAGFFATQIPDYRAVIFKRLTQPSDNNPPITLDPSMFTYFWNLYQLTSDPMFAQIMYLTNGKSVTGLPYDLFSDQSAVIQKELSAVIASHGDELRRGSTNKQDWRIAMMRSNRSDETPAFWLNYQSGGMHGHQDMLNLGLYAKGMDLMTDFGYPPVNLDGWTGKYSAWYMGPLSHNTVVVDDQSQWQGAGQTQLWLDEETLRAIRAAVPSIPGGQRFDRTVVMNEIDEEDIYLVDVIKVRSGRSHTRFMSSQYGTIDVDGLSLKHSENIWSGALLRNVMIDKEATPGWSADWTVENKHEYLPRGTKVHLKLTDLTTDAEAYIAEAWIQSDFNTAIEGWIPRTAVRRQHEDGDNSLLESTFVGVIEPYEGRSNIQSIRRLALTDSSDQLLPDSFVAIEITLTNGDRDLLLIADHEYKTADGSNLVMCQTNWGVKAQAELVHIRKNPQGEVKQFHYCNGTYVYMHNQPLRKRK